MIDDRVEIADARAHRFRVTLRIPRPAAVQALCLPAGAAGSHAVHDGARHLQPPSAAQGGHAVALQHQARGRWVANRSGRQPLVVRYAVHAVDNAVHGAFLDGERGCFDGSRILWFFEGFTSCDEQRLLHRAGLIDWDALLRGLARQLNTLLATAGRTDPAAPNTGVSVYAKGALIALCCDLRLRSLGAGTLDDVMRALGRRAVAGAVGEAEITGALGDELLAIDGWRLRRLEEARQWLGAARDQRLLHLRLPLPERPAAPLLSLRPDDGAGAAALALRRAWPGG